MDQLRRITRCGMKGTGVNGFILVADKDMEEAAHQLVQLSDEEKSNSIDNSSGVCKKNASANLSSIASAKKIEELFGREEEEEEEEEEDDDDGGEIVEVGEVCEEENKKKKKKKRRKCRLLADLYQVTKPLDNGRYSKKR